MIIIPSNLICIPIYKVQKENTYQLIIDGNGGDLIYDGNGGNLIITGGYANEGVATYNFKITSKSTHKTYQFVIDDYVYKNGGINTLLDVTDLPFGEYDYIIENNSLRLGEGLLRIVKPQRELITYYKSNENVVYEQ